MNFKPVLIIENNSSGLRLNESVSNKKEDKFILDGIFTEFDIKNRNDRIYTKDKFLPHLGELQERVKNLGVVYGEFDHPDIFDTSLSRVSHLIHSVTYNESANRVDGSIRLLKTHYGKEATALVLDGCPLFVSSRAAGVTESDGTVSIKKLFTYDCVADPGFSSARMNIRVLNESLGFNESANFRIYDMSDESKINELFTMNDNEKVTQEQMTEYSEYLKREMSKIKDEITTNIKEGIDPERLEKLSEYYENLMESYSKMSKYLDYIAENLQVLVTENDELKKTSNNLIKHGDYLAENLEKAINYSNYLAEQLDKSIDYGEYIAENLGKSIDFAEYIAENVQKTIKYSEYIAENLDKSIDYAEYLAEHTEFNISNTEMLSEYVDNSIKYSEYVAEQVDNTIAYSEYLAEHVDNNISYTEYVAEHVDNNIAYSEYIAENVSDTQAYSKYIAESLDKTLDILKTGKVNEELEAEDQRISDMKVANVDKYYDDEDDENLPVDETLPEEIQDIEEEENEVNPEEGNPNMEVPPTEVADGTKEEVSEPVQPVQSDSIPAEGGNAAPELPIATETPAPIASEVPSQQPELPLETPSAGIVPGMVVDFKTEDGSEASGEVLSYNPQDGFAIVKVDGSSAQPESIQAQPIDGAVQPEGIQAQAPVQAELELQVHESKLRVRGNKVFESEKSIKDQISQLILEAKKRKAVEESQPHFLLFLSEKNKSSWNHLSVNDKEKVMVALNESTYTSETEVLSKIREALDATTKSEEQILVEAIPVDLVDTWNSLNDTVKKSVLARAKFYPNLTASTAKMESFWNSRDLETFSSNPKKYLINENKTYVDDVKMSETQIDRYINVFKNL